MKKIIFSLLLIILIAFSSNALNTPLNKQQTLDYISKLYINARIGEKKIKGVELDGKI